MTFFLPAQPAATIRTATSTPAETRRMRARRYWKPLRGSTLVTLAARRAATEIRERHEVVDAMRGDRRREASRRREEQPEPGADHARPQHVGDPEWMEQAKERAG